MTDEIEKQVNVTAHQLEISPQSVFAVSAQKALVAKIKKMTHCYNVAAC